MQQAPVNVAKMKQGPSLNPEIVHKVQLAQIQLLYKQTWTGLVGVLVVAISGCAILWHDVPQRYLSLWIGSVILLTLARGYLTFSFFRKTPSAVDIKFWTNWHVLGVVASGILWVIPSALLWPTGNSVSQMVWPILILPLSAASVATYYTWKLSYVSFVLLTALPISVRFFSKGGYLFIILGLMALFYIAVLLRAGKVMHTASVRTFELVVSNEALNTKLTAGIEQVNKLNMELENKVTALKISEEKMLVRNQELVSLNEVLTRTKNDLENSNKKLEDAIANIKQLSSMLPICSSCKNIRNDSGYWEKLESYLLENSGIIFSHSICPDCAQKLYPDIYKKKI